MSSRRLNEMLEDINSRIATNLNYPNAKYFAQAELQVRDEKTFPLVNNGNSKGTSISLDRRTALQTYHRVLNSETDTNWSGGKGKYPYRMRTYTIRNVWLGSLSRLPRKDYETTDDVKTDVYNAFPTILDDKEIIRTVGENINKQAILNEEFEGQETKSLILELMIFTIDYEIKQKIICN